MNIDEKDFIKDIKRSDKISNFSLLVCEDKNFHKEQFLLKYDKRWKCYLFPYLRTKKENNNEYIINYCLETLNLNNFILNKTKIDNIEKYSVSDKITKKYCHTFYFCEFDSQKSFKRYKHKIVKINGEKYRWFSISEMKLNKNIMSKNEETVRFIEENL